MPVPLSVAAPATAAALAYINAKASVWYDVLFMSCTTMTMSRILWRVFRDRLNLFYLLEDYARAPATAAKPMLLFEGRSYTYADVYDRALRYGTWLRRERGVKPKEIVAINYENSETFIFLWFALWSIGAKPAFINYNLTGQALAHCVNAATTRLCLVDPRVAGRVDDTVVAQTGGKVDFVVFTPELQAQAEAAPAERAPDADRSEDAPSNMAILIYTSGTTGLPKPAVVSFGKCVAAGSIAQGLIGVKADDIVYTVSL
jgi:acyl-CoA synthetase (AMP-forming)/AMP-acid ligase II